MLVGFYRGLSAGIAIEHETWKEERDSILYCTPTTGLNACDDNLVLCFTGIITYGTGTNTCSMILILSVTSKPPASCTTHSSPLSHLHRANHAAARPTYRVRGHPHVISLAPTRYFTRLPRRSTNQPPLTLFPF